MENEMMMQPGMGTPQAEAGRGTDTVLAHMTLGEVVIPRAFLDDPDVLRMLQTLFQQKGAEMAEFTVGDPANKINPETGYPEFFSLGKFLRSALGVAAPLALSYFAPGLGTALGSSILGANAAGASTLGNALIGGGVGALSGGGLKGAGIGALTGGIGANLGGVGNPGEEGSGILGGVGRNVPGVQELASGISGLGDSLSNAIGGTSGVASDGLQVGKLYNGTAGENALLSNAQRGLTSTPSLLSNITGGSGGGGSSFGLAGNLASAIGGFNQDASIKKQKQQLLGANNTQLANLDSFDPSGITSDPGYEFNRAEGEKGLNRSLGATGDVFSGRALKAGADYNQNYANNAFKDYYSRWLTKTGAQNQLYGTGGDINANATGAGSQNLAQSLSKVFGGNNGIDPALIDLLLKRQGGAYA